MAEQRFRPRVLNTKECVTLVVGRREGKVTLGLHEGGAPITACELTQQECSLLIDNLVDAYAPPQRTRQTWNS